MRNNTKTHLITRIINLVAQFLCSMWNFFSVMLFSMCFYSCVLFCGSVSWLFAHVSVQHRIIKWKYTAAQWCDYYVSYATFSSSQLPSYPLPCSSYIHSRPHKSHINFGMRKHSQSQLFAIHFPRVTNSNTRKINGDSFSMAFMFEVPNV